MSNPTTGRRDLLANRWEPFVHVFAFQGQDLTGATFNAAIRAVKDATGAPLVALTNAATNAQGLALVSEGNEDVDFGGSIGVVNVPVSYVQMRINEVTMEGLPFPFPRGPDQPLYWDLQITPTGADKYRALEGTFTVHAGVTGTS